jgi:hypothetical protein
MPGGRPPLGPSLADDLEGPDESKHRLKVLLQVIAKEKTAEQACAELGVQRARLYELLNEVLKGGLEALRPKKIGRRGKPPASPEAERIAALEKQVEDLTFELHTAEVRERIAEALPHVVERREAKKKDGPAKRKKPW